MGFFDRFKRKHEVAPASLPKAARTGVASAPAPDTTDASAPSQEAHPLKDDRGILIKPVVTEKATQLSRMGQYLFFVTRNASKGAIRDAVQHRYGVKPVAVNVQRYEGSAVRFGRRFGMTKGFKKAIVTLPKGKRIDVVKTEEKPA